MIKIKWFKDLLVQNIPFLMITMTLAMVILSVQSFPFLLKDSFPSILLSSTFEEAYADHGQEITIILHNSSFGSLTSGGGNHVSVFASYELNDNSISGQAINAVMEVYTPNGTLIRTSSYPTGFIAQGSGGVEGLETTIRDPTVQGVTANVTFRNLEKTALLSNDLRVELNFAGEGTAQSTIEKVDRFEEEGLNLDSESEQTTDLPQPADEEESAAGEGDGDDGEGEIGNSEEDTEDEGQELPLPLFE